MDSRRVRARYEVDLSSLSAARSMAETGRNDGHRVEQRRYKLFYGSEREPQRRPSPRLHPRHVEDPELASIRPGV